jgi:hypothetical protein
MESDRYFAGQQSSGSNVRFVPNSLVRSGMSIHAKSEFNLKVFATYETGLTGLPRSIAS